MKKTIFDQQVLEKKLMRAKVSVVLDQPFFATLLVRKKFVPDDSVKTSVTNGQTIRYNPEWFMSLKPEELKGVICHEAMHTAMLHHTRREGREAGKWNMACDYSINGIIKKSGMQLPEGYIHDPQFDDMSAESIYKMMPTDKNNDSEPGEDDPGGCGGVEDADTDTKSMDQQEAEAKQELAQAIQMGKQAGKLPGGMELLMQILQPRVEWKEVLARFVSEPAKNDYSFSKPNKRYLHSGFILPSLYNLEVGEIVLLVDTSVSMDEDMLNKVFTEIHDVAGSFAAHITVVYIDTQVQGHQLIEPDDDVKLEPKGGGGTDFRPGFEWLEEQGIVPKSCIYFTDGECYSFPDKEPEYPVLWAKTGGYKFKPPFGEVIQID